MDSLPPMTVRPASDEPDPGPAPDHDSESTFLRFLDELKIGPRLRRSDRPCGASLRTRAAVRRLEPAALADSSPRRWPPSGRATSTPIRRRRSPRRGAARTWSRSPAPPAARPSPSCCRSSRPWRRTRKRCAILLYPTKALAQDQLKGITRLAETHPRLRDAHPRRHLRRRHLAKRAAQDPRRGQPHPHQPRHAPPRHPALSRQVAPGVQAAAPCGGGRGAHLPGHLRVQRGQRVPAPAPACPPTTARTRGFSAPRPPSATRWSWWKRSPGFPSPWSTTTARRAGPRPSCCGTRPIWTRRTWSGAAATSRPRSSSCGWSSAGCTPSSSPRPDSNRWSTVISTEACVFCEPIGEIPEESVYRKTGPGCCGLFITECFSFSGNVQGDFEREGDLSTLNRKERGLLRDSR